MLQNRTVLITGAAGGIGFAIAEACAQNGARVVISDLHEDGALAAAERLRSQGRQSFGIGCDVTDEADIQKTVAAAVERFGSVDVLVNNAGLQHVAALEDFPTDKFEQMTRVMLVAPFIFMKHVFPLMKRQRFGRIINIASINGLVGFAGKAAYNSAKHGVIGLTKVAALEGAEYGITVNALCPGYVDTPLVRNQLEDLARLRGVGLEEVLQEVIYPLVPQKRLLSPREVADYAVFLASEQAKGVTGQAAVIDGGYTAQ